jgi:hypothetical protein
MDVRECIDSSADLTAAFCLLAGDTEEAECEIAETHRGSGKTEDRSIPKKRLRSDN